jgi:hypothetical protein
MRGGRSEGQRTPPAVSTWSRQKMLALLAGVAIVACLLVLGLVLGVAYALQPAGHHGTGAPGLPGAGASGAATTPTGNSIDPAQAEQAARDELAARPMPVLDETAARPAPVATKDPGTIVLPRPTRTGPAGVPTGFGRTPEGAMAQLAAIDQTAMQSGSLAGVRAVIAAWAQPGGPTASSWSGVAAMIGLLDSAGLSGGGSPQLALVVTPLMGLIKGSLGTDFVLPCIDYEFDATLEQTARVAVADCQRMVWAGDRWMIGPGSEPADAASVWPDTDQAISVGYRDLRNG